MLYSCWLSALTSLVCLTLMDPVPSLLAAILAVTRVSAPLLSPFTPIAPTQHLPHPAPPSGGHLPHSSDRPPHGGPHPAPHLPHFLDGPPHRPTPHPALRSMAAAPLLATASLGRPNTTHQAQQPSSLSAPPPLRESVH